MAGMDAESVDVDAADAAPTGSDPTVVEGRARKEQHTPGEPRAGLLRGTVVGRYVVLDRIGAGGMGIVYAAYDPDLNRRVALKVMRPGKSGAARAPARMLREAQALARLAHPNVVAIHDVGTVGETVFIAMELVEGKTLSLWLSSEKRPWRDIVRAFVAAGEGLVAAHTAGVIHRDFKPNNVLVGDDGRVRVMDFGLAREGHELPTDEDHASSPEYPRGSSRDMLGERLTKAGSVLGTPLYMPPEAFRGETTDERGDQFSFCVGLYDALYGKPPFPTDQPPDEDARWIVRPLPRSTPVPRWVGDLVMRGLARAPGERHPSMRALIDALGRDPRRRNRRIAAVAAVALAGAGAFGVTRLLHARAVGACDAEGAQIDAVYTARRNDAIATAFAASPVAYATETWGRASDQLRTYAASWRATRTGVCMRADVDKAVPADRARATRACLDDQKSRFDALLAELAKPDATSVQSAATAAASLASPTACTDETRRYIDPPAASQQRVRELRAGLSTVRALLATGHYDEGLTQAKTVLDQCKALGWAPLTADASMNVATAQDQLGHYDEARAAYEDAFFTAAAAGQDELALEAGGYLVYVIGYHQAKPDDALHWGRLAQMFADRLGGGDDLGLAWLLGSLGAVHLTAGDFTAAVPVLERAEAIQERLLGGDHPEVAKALSNLGAAYGSLGDHAKALPVFERALAILDRTLGPDHPDVAQALGNVGIEQFQLGDRDKARAAFERSLAVYEAALGPDHPTVATAVESLGNLEHAVGNLDQALALQQRALAIREHALGPDHLYVAGSLENLGNVYADMGDAKKSIEMLERSVAITEKAMGPEHPDLATALDNLASTYVDVGDTAKALPLEERALAIREKVLGPDHPDVAYSLEELGRIREARHEVDKAAELYQRTIAIREKIAPDHPDLLEPLFNLGMIRYEARAYADAVPLLERAVAICDKAEVTPDRRAATGFALAQALWDGNTDRARAVTLATAARDAYGPLGEPSAADLAEVTAWLAKHPAP